MRSTFFFRKEIRRSSIRRWETPVSQVKERERELVFTTNGTSELDTIVAIERSASTVHRVRTAPSVRARVWYPGLARDRFDGVVVPRILSLRSFLSWSISHPSGPPTRTKGTITPALAHVGARGTFTLVSRGRTFNLFPLMMYRPGSCTGVVRTRYVRVHLSSKMGSTAVLFFLFALAICLASLFDDHPSLPLFARCLLHAKRTSCYGDARYWLWVSPVDAFCR